MGNAVDSCVFKLQFEPLNEDDSVSYKNFNVSTMVEITENISIAILKNEQKIYAKMSVTDISQFESEYVKVFLGSYSKNGLSHIEFYDIPISDFINGIEKEFITDSNTVYVKCFLWTGGEHMLVPKGKAVQYSLK